MNHEGTKGYLFRAATREDDDACAELLAPVYGMARSELVSEYADFRSRFTDFGDLNPGMLGFVACDGKGRVIGVIEASIRLFAIGCDGSPVVFIEGVAVEESHRRQGIAKGLAGEVERWALDRGIRHLASDALVDNAASHAWHERLGFQRTPAVTNFAKAVANQERS